MKRTRVGARVHVFAPDTDEDWGLGTIIRVEDLIDDDTGVVFSTNFPIIQLDSGRDIHGLDCWWHEVVDMK